MFHGTSVNDFIHAVNDGLVAPPDGNDLTLATTAADALAGWGGDDMLSGGGGADSLYGGAGDDLLLANGGFVPDGRLFEGGDGVDVLFGTSTDQAALTNSTIHGVEQIRGFSGGLILTTGQLAEFDTVDSGQIFVHGGGSIDLTDTSIRAPKIVLDSLEATSLVLSAGQMDPATGTFSVFSGTVFGGNGDDALTVTDGTGGLTSQGITLNGGFGDDTLTSANGATVLIGGRGVDHLYAGSYATTFVLDYAQDVVAGEVYQGKLRSYGYRGTIIDGTAVNTQTDFSEVTVTGINKFVGFSGGLTLTVGQLSDRVFDTGRITVADGGEIRDIGLLADSIKLSDFGNTLSVANYGYTNEVGGFKGTVIGGAGDDDVNVFFSGYHSTGAPAAVKLFGRDGDDILFVEAGNSTLSGGSGDDTLSGGYESSALMTGGKGDDLFQITLTQANVETITDFAGLHSTKVGDLLQYAERGDTSHITYIGAQGFNASGSLEVRYSQQRGALMMDIDGDGDVDSTLILTGMTAATDLTQADFL